VRWKHVGGQWGSKGFICGIACNEEALQTVFTEDDLFFMVETVDVSSKMK